MSIQEKINQDLKQAMLDKNEAKKSLLRVVIGEFNRVDKIVDDAKATAILKKMMENAKLVNNTAEIVVLEEYVPKQLEGEELEVAILEVITETGSHTKAEMGKVMAALKTKYAGAYDGKVASEFIRKHLV